MIIDKLLQTDQPVYDIGFSDADLQLIGNKITVENSTDVKSKYELNLYSFNGILINSFVQESPVELEVTPNGPVLNVNLTTYFDQSNINSGKYYYTINAYNQIGGIKSKNLVIQEISATRQELRLLKTEFIDSIVNTSNPTSELYNNQDIINNQALDIPYSTAADVFSNILTIKKNFKNVYLNFGQDRMFRVINIELGPAPEFDVLVKLYEPLPVDIDTKQACELSDVIFQYGDIAEYTQYVEIIDTNVLIQPPNFNIDLDQYKSSATEFQTWNDLLNVNLSTSQQIIDSYFGESLKGIKLNIDYSKPDQFIFYSSAEERFNNFYYKVQLLEDYNDQLNVLNNINQTSKTSNIIDVVKKRNKIITGFDDFEKYLYFGNESGSLYTFYTGSIPTWPKTTTGSLSWLESYNYWVDNYTTGSLNPNIGYNLLNTTSTTVKEYASNTIAIMQAYDVNNINSLLKTVPASILLDDQNSEYFIFVNMIGHHFDIIYTYINHLSSIHSREQHPLDGISKELLSAVSDSFGWKLTNSKKKSSLWQYITGLDSNGNYLQSGSTTPTISSEQYTVEVWNRIVNNLPYLLKTKGTRRSIQALMSCYGIPSTIINIKEYGGPTQNDIKPLWHVDKFLYSLEIGNTGSEQVSIPWDKLASTNRNPDSIQFRFKPDPTVILYPRTLLMTDNARPYIYITYDQPAGYNAKEGQITYYVNQGGSTYASGILNNVPMFNNDWTSILLTRTPLTGSTASSSFQIQAIVKNYENIVYNQSCSFTGSNLYYNSGSNILIGHSSYNTSNRAFDGNLSEFRYWSYTLNNDAHTQFARNPLFFGGNADPDSYNYLDFRIPLTYSTDISGSSLKYYSVHPNQDINSFSGSIGSYATLSNFISTDLGGEDYTTYVEIPSLGSDNILTNKIRIIDTTTTASLNTDISVEMSTATISPIDTNVIGIYMSPQEMIDSDIYNQLGYFEIDDYIGDPADQNNSYYTDLSIIQNQYWKKYKNSNNLPLLLKLLSVYDYSFFDQLKQLLPARVAPNVGITIKQNVLERSKITILDDFTGVMPMYADTIDVAAIINVSGDYPTYSASIDLTNQFEAPGIYNYSSSRYVDGIGTVEMMVRYEPTGSVILQNTLSLTRQIFYPIYKSEYSASVRHYDPISSSYRAAEVQDYNYELTAFKRPNYDGTKISSPGYNVPSNDLPDKSAVIYVTTTTPGTLRNNPSIPAVPNILGTGVVPITNPQTGIRSNAPSLQPTLPGGTTNLNPTLGGYSNTGFNIIR